MGTNLKVRTEMVAVNHYTWNCPDCGEKKYSQRDPGLDDLRCGPCDNKKASRDFHIRFVAVIGATVESIKPPEEIYYDDIVRTLYLRDATGDRWFVGSNADLFVYRVDEDGEVV